MSNLEVVAGEKKAIVSESLMAQVMDLCLGGMIQKIESDAEQENAYNLMKLVKATAQDIRSEYDKKALPLLNDLDQLREEYFPLIKQLTGEKMDSKGGVVANLSRVVAEYQMEKDRIAKEEAAKQQAIIDAENARLAKIEADKAEEADKLREDAEEAKGEKKEELLLKAEEADKAALDASKQLGESIDAPAPVRTVFKPSGLKVEMVYSAKVIDHWAALLWLVKNEGRGYIEARSDFRKAVESAMNAVAKLKGENFNADGCTKLSTPKGK